MESTRPPQLRETPEHVMRQMRGMFIALILSALLWAAILVAIALALD